MKNIDIIYVVESPSPYKYENQKRVFLREDNWDDWFKYKTMYRLTYYNEENREFFLGDIKIGERELESGRPNIENKFTMLRDEFFSLGQSVNYYDNLKKLPNEVRKKILKDLRDIAYDTELLHSVENEDVLGTSLLRSVYLSSVKNQYHRIANGGVTLTPYNFGYRFAKSIEEIDSPTITFEVEPASNPPTNIHVLIGRNGVGKTHLLKNMIYTITQEDRKDDRGYFFDLYSQSLPINPNEIFTNLVFVTFSAFDNFPLPQRSNNTNKKTIDYLLIGLDYNEETTEAERIDEHYNEKTYVEKRIENLTNQFIKSFRNCYNVHDKYQLLKESIEILNYDTYFKESDISLILGKIDIEKANEINELKKIFEKFSSGHKIILLTITRLAECVEEKSLLLIDEPETHLHPPLLAAYIRTLSNILIKRNGVAFITTHSPIVLQEVPASCAWKIQRSGKIVRVDRLEQETFGTNINSLTREIFGFEVEKSGFNKLLNDVLEKFNYDYNATIAEFNDELGDEAKALLSMISYKKRSELK